jgi:ERCC4-type nuclease
MEEESSQRAIGSVEGQTSRATEWPWPSWIGPPTIRSSRTATRIVVDDRERGSGVIEQLTNTAGLRIEVGRLETGDYLIGVPKSSLVTPRASS